MDGPIATVDHGREPQILKTPANGTFVGFLLRAESFQKSGSQQESDRRPISRGFLECDKFDLGRGHALRFE
jgi:hypothetical protein